MALRIDVRRWRDAIRDAPELCLATRGLLLALTKWMDQDGSSCYPGGRNIAAVCGISKRQVDRHLREALDAGYLVVDAPAHGRRHATYAAAVPEGRWDGRKVIEVNDVIASSLSRNGQKKHASSETPPSCKPQVTRHLRPVTLVDYRTIDQCLRDKNGLFARHRVAVCETYEALLRDITVSSYIPPLPTLPTNTSRARELPEWCGMCDITTRLIYGNNRAAMCPVCNPLLLRTVVPA